MRDSTIIALQATLPTVLTSLRARGVGYCTHTSARCAPWRVPHSLAGKSVHGCTCRQTLYHIIHTPHAATSKYAHTPHAVAGCVPNHSTCAMYRTLSLVHSSPPLHVTTHRCMGPHHTPCLTRQKEHVEETETGTHASSNRAPLCRQVGACASAMGSLVASRAR